MEPLASGNTGDVPEELAFTVENVESRWLTGAQASPQAWHFCWALLSPDKLPEIQFFGASTLHTKISHHWADLGADQQETLRTQLLSQVLLYSSGPKMVLTRLCVALASLALNLVPEAWPQPVADLVRAFEPEKDPAEGVEAAAEIRDPPPPPPPPPPPSPPHARCLALLELLTVLPEEFQSSRLPQARRAQLRQALAGQWASVCPLLRQLLQSGDSGAAPAQERALRCLAAWTAPALGGVVETLGGETGGLLRDCFATLGEPALFDTAVETIVSVLSQPDCQRSLTLTFWYTLQDDILSLEEERQAVYLQVYREVYFQLVEVLLLKSHYASEEEYASWSADDKEQFRIYRVDISDTLMYVYEMLGAELLSNLYDRLARLVLSPEQAAVWQDIEALLFGFQSIAETIDVNYSDVIPGLIGLIPRISISNVMLADTVMYTIGSLAEWLADHPVMLATILPMVLQGLAKPELSVSSVSTLKRICRECQHDLAPYAHDIIHVSQDVLVKDVHKSLETAGPARPPPPRAPPNPAVCGVFEKSVRTLLHAFGPMMVHIFAGEREIFGPVQGLVEAVTSATLAIFQQGPRDHPDIVDSFMQLHAQIFKRKPDLYLSERLDVSSLFYCGVMSLKFPEASTVRSATLFFTELLPRFKDVPPVGAVFLREGKLLAVGGEASRSLGDHFSEVLFSMNRNCLSLLARWLEETLRDAAFPFALVTAEHKDAFRQRLLREQTNKRQVKEVVREFSLLCRGQQGGGYSTQQ
ncbi:hypothetical protein CRUP_011844 [Coryphaenoides rupestris]|nr:hypothetical protein CRUP_011844 [Coryphaenoides rupestris]